MCAIILSEILTDVTLVKLKWDFPSGLTDGYNADNKRPQTAFENAWRYFELIVFFV